MHMQVTELSAHDSAKEARILEYLRCDVVLIPFSVVDKKSFHNAMHKVLSL